MKEKEEWLDEMELRLKRAFLDVADLNKEEGQHFLAQEVRSHLEDVTGEITRRDYLLSLRERFPLLLEQSAKISEVELGEVFQSSSGAAAAEAAAEKKERPELSIEAAMEKVRREWGSLPESTRQAFLRDCSSGEIKAAPEPSQAPKIPEPAQAPEIPKVPVKPAHNKEETFQEASDEFIRFLKLEREAPLSPERIQEIFISLLKTVAQVDALGTQVYKQLQLSREVSQGDLRKMVGDYVTGSSMDAAELNRLLDQSRIKVGLIISTIASLPGVLSQTHLSKFQPSLIEQMAGAGGLLGSKEARCWKKYLAMAGDLEPRNLEKAINDLMVAQLKKLKRS